MKKYFTNGSQICRYPAIALPPCGSQVFWLEVRTRNAKPGIYEFSVDSSDGARMPVLLEVLPVVLPRPKVWVKAWSPARNFSRLPATSWPFKTDDALPNTVSDKISRGISSFSGVPVPGSEAYEARRQKQDVTFFYSRVIPGYWVHNGYCGVKEKFDNPDAEKVRQIAGHVKDVVRKFKDAGVPYEKWFGELWDEPGDRNAKLFEQAALWVREIDPEVQIYANPAFPNDVGNFQRMSRVAKLFVPFWGNWFRGKEWISELRHDRPVNAMYAIFGACRSELHEELAGHYRILPWQAFRLGLNGWGFYSYYAPRNDPYCDYLPEGKPVDYQVVYPGLNGPVPSRQAEAFRDGWEDYCLLSLIREQGTPAAIKELESCLQSIPMEREPATSGVDFETMRIRLLRASTK